MKDGSFRQPCDFVMCVLQWFNYIFMGPRLFHSRIRIRMMVVRLTVYYLLIASPILKEPEEVLGSGPVS